MKLALIVFGVVVVFLLACTISVLSSVFKISDESFYEKFFNDEDENDI